MTATPTPSNDLVGYERDFAKMVRDDIRGARLGKKIHTGNLWLLEESLMEAQNPGMTPYKGFHSWLTWMTEQLGEDRCREIGTMVCSEEGFTADDARALMVKHPKQNIGFSTETDLDGSSSDADE
jgi:hypothetical protein